MKTGHYVSVDGIRTHYLEAGAEHGGKRPSVLLLRRIVGAIFYDPKYAKDDAYIERRVEIGAWEATQAARFRAPFRQSPAGRSGHDNIDYASIKVPTLVFAGRHDPLRYPGYTDAYVPKIPNAQLHMFENAAHMGNVECADEFNARTLDFLNSVTPLARERQRCRVGEDVATLAPHRPERARLTHSVPRARASLTMSWMT
jgi:hypothetical protein